MRHGEVQRVFTQVRACCKQALRVRHEQAGLPVTRVVPPLPQTAACVNNTGSPDCFMSASFFDIRWYSRMQARAACAWLSMAWHPNCHAGHHVQAVCARRAGWMSAAPRSSSSCCCWARYCSSRTMTASCCARWSAWSARHERVCAWWCVWVDRGTLQQTRTQWPWLVQVKQVAENPLARHHVDKPRPGARQQLETAVLENSISKICSLLSVSGN